MQLRKSAAAGTLESGDIMIEIEKSDTPGVSIELKSTVSSQFGRQIKKTIEQTLAARGVSGVCVFATDKGALDCTIRARVTAAVLRACEAESFDWE